MLEKIKENIKNALMPKALFLLISAVCGYYLYGMGTRLFEDSQSYINNSVLRTPVYPLVIDFFENFFPGDYLNKLFIFQIAFGFLCAYALARALRDGFKLSNWAGLFIYMILLAPFYGSNGIANKIMAESITYSVFMITVTFFVRSFFELTNKNIVMFVLAAVLTALTRPQFLFIYPAVIIFYFYVFKSVKNFRQILWLSVALIVFITGSSVFQKGYNYYKHGYFSGIPFTGVQLITPALYLSDSSEAGLFTEDKKAVEYLEAAYARIETEKLSSKFNAAPSFLEFATHYGVVYNEISWRTAYDIYREKYAADKEKKELSVPEIIEFDKFSTGIAVKILKNHYAQYIKLYMANILKGIGGYFYAGFLLFILYASFAIYRDSGEASGMAVFFITLLNFFNYTLISVVEPVMMRYTFYTDTIQFAALVSLILLLKNKISASGAGAK